MANKDGERRMVFDTGGRRKSVVKVVYAILAVLMGLSLLLVVGPAPLQDLFGGGSTSNGAEPARRPGRADRTQTEKGPGRPRAAAEPDPGADQRRQLAGGDQPGNRRSRLHAGVRPAAAGGERILVQVPEGDRRTELRPAPRRWRRRCSPWRRLARTGPEAELNVRAAADAQQIVADSRPSLGSLSTLAIYRSTPSTTTGQQRRASEAMPYANTKFERENLENELDQIEKRAHEFQKQLQEIEKEAKKARAEGKGSVSNPLGENNPLGARRGPGRRRVGREGLEPSTLSLRGSCSNQLS